MDGIIFLCAFWAFVGFLWHKYGRNEQEPPELPELYKPDTDLLLTLQQIDELKITAERIRQLENILTDLDIIDNAEKGISLSVPSISGSSTEYSFISSKTDTSGFKTAAQSECDRLKRELQKQIRALQTGKTERRAKQ